MISVRQLVKALTSLGAPLLVGGLSGYLTAGAVESWYPTLTKPFFNPPAWIFGPVWTALYLLMGVAAFLVWRRGLDAEGVRPALALFSVQLILNGLWSIVFFGLQSPGGALVEIAFLWAAIVATVWSFRRVSGAAALLLLPYLAWVSFAAVLNASIWWLNG